jgi:hypothetical protein
VIRRHPNIREDDVRLESVDCLQHLVERAATGDELDPLGRFQGPADPLAREIAVFTEYDPEHIRRLTPSRSEFERRLSDRDMSGHASDSGACLIVRVSPSNDASTIAPTTDHPENRPEPDRLRAAGLTSAELELLPLLMRYLSLTEISETVGLPRGTIEIQARSIYRKLGVSPSDLTV